MDQQLSAKSHYLSGYKLALNMAYIIRTSQINSSKPWKKGRDMLELSINVFLTRLVLLLESSQTAKVAPVFPLSILDVIPHSWCCGI